VSKQEQKANESNRNQCLESIREQMKGKPLFQLRCLMSKRERKPNLKPD